MTDELNRPGPSVIDGDGTRAWWALALLTVPCVVVVMDLTVLFLAMPSIVPDIGASASAALWITDVYGFLIAASLLTMGSLADRIGRRRALVIGASAFGVASAIAALAPDATVLILARALQGVAGAAVVPSAMALAFTLFSDEHRRARAMAVLMGSFAAGGALGPVLGGLLLVSFHWSAVFWLNVPLMALVVIAGPRLLPTVPGDPTARTDLVSVGLSITGILALVYGAKHGSLEGVDAIALTGLAVGAAGLTLFVLRQRRIAAPALDLTLFRAGGFGLGLTTNVVTSFVMFGVSMLLALYIQLGLGLTPLLAAVVTLPGMLALVATTTLVPRLVRTVPQHTLVGTGLLLVGAGLLALSAMPGMGGLWGVVVANVVISIGVAPTTVLVTQIVIGAAPAHAAGTASGAAQAANELGGALGIALLGALAAAVYRLGVPPGDGLPDTYAGLIGSPGARPAELLTMAHTAFVDGVSLALLAAAGVIAVMGVVVIVRLR
ncbi:MFS transporter [Pseudonocardia sp. TRM90224]|uniref:MFS transporter n=1 Tax=Pseudonocardia sp. TRM90224 TaxID=2812678 RepID=UPI001E2E62A6|nr:MFS transporter [Pseudonocardia sp. TRM90224]